MKITIFLNLFNFKRVEVKVVVSKMHVLPFLLFLYSTFLAVFAADLPEPRIVVIGQTGSGTNTKV